MRLRTPTDIVALIRERRRALGLDQAELARRVGVSRKWVVGIEQGKSRADLGLVLPTLDALGIVLRADEPGGPGAAATPGAAAGTGGADASGAPGTGPHTLVSVDDILEAHRGRKPGQ